MSQDIKFIAKNPFFYDVALKPYPARQNVPSWHKEMGTLIGKKMSIDSGGVANYTAKKCIPMLDAIISGYIIPLWADILVSKEGDSTSLSWTISDAVMEVHSTDTTMGMYVPDGYSEQVFKFRNVWSVRTPPGYSSLIIDPIGNTDSPFRAIPAVIDTDKSYTQILPPVFLKENFEGIIEKGTPIAQIIPFKRTDWKATFETYAEGEIERLENKNFKGTILDHYRKFVWSRKKYD
jgi:hypothetical protein